MTALVISADHANELQIALASDAAFEASCTISRLPCVYAYLMSRSGHDATLAEELSQQTFFVAIAERARYDGRATILDLAVRHRTPQARRPLPAAPARGTPRDERPEAREIQARRGPGPYARPRRTSRHPRRGRAFAPSRQRAVLAFVVLDDLPVAEAGRLMGKSTAATHSSAAPGT